MATGVPSRRPLANASNNIARLSGNFENVTKPMSPISPTTGHGLARTPSLRGRPIRRVPLRASVESNEDTMEENDSKTANAQLIADLREQLERTEQASEQYRKQLEMLQQRLDESTDQQTAAEEREFAAKTQIDKLLAEVKDAARHGREMEMNFESERKMFAEEQERTVAREAELQAVVNRLTDTLKTKNLERASTARISSMTDENVDKSAQQSSQQQHEELMSVLHEKDATIDALKIELADIHIKAAEHEHMGDGQLQLLEKQLSDIKMQNARLLEENDSFQMLLSEKTLKGDFVHDTSSETAGMSSLAEELESIGEDEEISAETYRKLEAELRTTKEEKKALNLYIDKIIGRLLQHDGFEHIITGKDESEAPSPSKMALAREKPLPQAPVMPVSNLPSPTLEAPPTAIGGFLQRAKSVVARGGPKARPMSYIQTAPTANENPATAPSIPINKGHRRARSDQLQTLDIAGPANNRTASGGPMSPGIGPLGRAQTSFALPVRSDTMRAPSQTSTTEVSSSANSMTSDQSPERLSTELTSAQTSTHTRDSNPPAVVAGVMKQHQLRPLQLVNQAANEDAQRKAANRQSWMGWFNKTSIETHQ